MSLNAFIPNENQFLNVNGSAALEICNVLHKITKNMEYRIILLDSTIFHSVIIRLDTRKMFKMNLLNSTVDIIVFIRFSATRPATIAFCTFTQSQLMELIWKQKPNKIS